MQSMINTNGFNVKPDYQGSRKIKKEILLVSRHVVEPIEAEIILFLNAYNESFKIPDKMHVNTQLTAYFVRATPTERRSPEISNVNMRNIIDHNGI